MKTRERDRLPLVWAALAFVVTAASTYAWSGRLFLSILAGLVSALGAGLYWRNLLRIGERPPRRRRHVDDSKLR